MAVSSSPDLFKSPLPSILNFRDVGLTISNLNPSTPLPPLLLYRSARPDEASSDDRAQLADTYKVRTVIDLRSKSEHIEQARKRQARLAAETPQATAEDSDNHACGEKLPGAKYIEIDLNGGAFSRALLWRLSWWNLSKLLTLMAVGRRIEAINILAQEVMAPRGLLGLAEDSLAYSKDEIRAVFHVLATEQDYPVLLHCTQGKDRTGIVVILLLAFLNVPVSVIEREYMASEKELEAEQDERLSEIKRIGLPQYFAGCPPDFVTHVLSHIQSQYGGVKAYLLKCGLEQSSLSRIKQIWAVDTLSQGPL